jgi:hypothetical protein
MSVCLNRQKVLSQKSDKKWRGLAFVHGLAWKDGAWRLAKNRLTVTRKRIILKGDIDI